MKKIFFTTLIILIALFTQAQQDPKAKSILDEVSTKTKTFKTISADFSFSLENKAMSINEKNDGSIKLKGQKYFVDLPGTGYKVYSDGKTSWTYMKQGNQVTISLIEDAGNDLMDPSSLFSIYEKGFTSKFIAEKNVGGKPVYQIDLFPDKKEYDVSKISIEINKATMMIQSAQLYGTDGNIYGIVVKTMDTNKDFSDTDFVFDAKKYPDVEVIDLR
ncbi:MAG TPA: outer membrane lipoprotein carrier protein LolA [Draconibacterium sp.]|jgi:outer membrane lipoprotein-sorting protein|nr:outer membrane lipoprotein carrier protein LolA [Draconibacterium sp.]